MRMPETKSVPQPTKPFVSNPPEHVVFRKELNGYPWYKPTIDVVYHDQTVPLGQWKFEIPVSVLERVEPQAHLVFSIGAYEDPNTESLKTFQVEVEMNDKRVFPGETNNYAIPDLTWLVLERQFEPPHLEGFQDWDIPFNTDRAIVGNGIARYNISITNHKTGAGWLGIRSIELRFAPLKK